MDSFSVKLVAEPFGSYVCAASAGESINDTKVFESIDFLAGYANISVFIYFFASDKRLLKDPATGAAAAWERPRKFKCVLCTLKYGIE